MPYGINGTAVAGVAGKTLEVSLQAAQDLQLVPGGIIGWMYLYGVLTMDCGINSGLVSDGQTTVHSVDTFGINLLRFHGIPAASMFLPLAPAIMCINYFTRNREQFFFHEQEAASYSGLLYNHRVCACKCANPDISHLTSCL